MVKANAYGHGIRAVAQRLDESVEAFGVASIDEAMALRQAGVRAPITLIEGVFTPQELSLAASQEFAVVFHSAHQLRWLAESALSCKLVAWMKINTGMGRLGFAQDQAQEAWQALAASPFLQQPVGIMSHFACADEPDHPLNAQQIAAFQNFTHTHPGARSFRNSAALFAFPDLEDEWVRPGLALYGASPLAGQSAESLNLKPVMTLHTELIAVQRFAQGSTIGYGARYTCAKDQQVGIVAIGYGDGYPRAIRPGMPVLVDGTRCTLIGRVSMDMCAVDLTPCLNAQIGSSVTLWGKGLPIEELLPFTDRIAYDLLTGVQNRVKNLFAIS